MQTGISLVPIVGLLILVCLFVAGIILIVKGVRGRIDLSSPRCRKCGFDLRRPDDAWTRCPECGADIEGGKAVLFGRHRKQPGLIVTGVVLIVIGPIAVMLLGVLGAGMSRRAAMGTMALTPGGWMSPPQLQALANKALVLQLTLQHLDPWVWQELESRRVAGTISHAELQTALEGVLESFAGEASPQPLIWGRAERDTWFAAGIAPKDFISTWKLRFTGLQAELPERSRPGEALTFQIRSNGGMGDPTLVAWLHRVTDADGRDLGATFDDRRDSRALSSRRHSIHGTMATELTPGEHEVRFVLTVGRVDPVLAAGLNQADLPPVDQWPESIDRLDVTLTCTLTIVDPAAPLIETTVDPQLRSAVHKALQPQGIAAVRHADGRVTLTVVRPQQARKALSIPVVVRQEVRVGEQHWPVGSFGFHMSRGYSANARSRADGLDRTTTVADVVLIVDPELAVEAQYVDLAPIWGEDILYEDVPITWIDEAPKG